MEICDRGLENAARGRRPRAEFSSPRSQFFTMRNNNSSGFDNLSSFRLIVPSADDF